MSVLLYMNYQNQQKSIVSKSRDDNFTWIATIYIHFEFVIKKNLEEDIFQTSCKWNVLDSKSTSFQRWGSSLITSAQRC